MTATKPARVCDECRYDGGWHYDEDGNASRCGQYLAAEQLIHARELAKLANESAWEAAQAVMRDVAETLPQFNANVIRDRFDAAGIPTSLRGSAFTWAAKKELIVKAQQRVMSTEESTRHPVEVWNSLVYSGRRAGVAS